VPTEAAAGQFEEHEVARMVAPLLFSFADHEASPTVVARVGSGVHPDGIPQVSFNWFAPLCCCQMTDPISVIFNRTLFLS
jgi:hypothetical protein